MMAYETQESAPGVSILLACLGIIMILVCITWILKLLLPASGGFWSGKVRLSLLHLSVFLIWPIISELLASLVLRLLIVALIIPNTPTSWGCVLARHNAHEAILYFDAWMLDWCVDGLVEDERIIDDLNPIANRFGSDTDSCPIEIDSVLYDVITFTGWPQPCHIVHRVWDLRPTWLFEDPCFHPCNLNRDVAYNFKSCRLSDWRTAQ